MKKIVLFDMDGTLTPARQSMAKEVADKLQELQEAGFEIGILTGSDLNYVQEQCKAMFSHFSLDRYAIHFLPCNGTKYYRFRKEGFLTVYENDMREKLGKDNWRRMIRMISGFQLSLVDNDREIPLTGNFINYRGSTLNWCPIGRQAGTEDREKWCSLDKHNWIRNKWLKYVRDSFDSSGLENVEVKLGGDTSFDIFPKGWDKTLAFKNFEDYEKIFFVGDRCDFGGNDKEAYELAGELGFKTTGPKQTIQIINQIIKEHK